ncbi:hypothetical protein RHSIM_Rhsim03G0155600 [Rhododendron simsii]|uniref:Uncharacterized protein n=1 Tax=Rhododendron simsii TaxID=118357 RepID=A0A834LT84_RHOSS|nr:hypothetical protein RHSIM_Rhsim03G0155600 [Rhododendron simsii]
MDENNMVQIPFTQSPSNPSPSLPLRLSCFLSGDTVQVQVDTKAFQFAVQFNIHRKHHHHNSETHVQVYEDMALKDNARYKLQCNLWKNQVHNKVN